MINKQIINVGIVGCGTVGAGTADILLKQKQVIYNKTGIEICLKQISALDFSEAEKLNIPKEIYNKDVSLIYNDPEIDIAVELVGGCDFAKDFCLNAINNKKHVVTANKALIASYWHELLESSCRNNVNIMFEASVGGGIPIIKALNESFSANNIQSVMGIINGTANYILTEMKNTSRNLNDVLKEAQDLGYAEADPTYDIEGIDTAHKLVILVSLAFGLNLSVDDIYVEGISKIELSDILYAEKLGYSIKLLAIAKEIDNKVDVRVHPTFTEKSNLLSSVEGVFNAIRVCGDFVGESVLYGRGAGRYPTASSVVSDIIDTAVRIQSGSIINYSKGNSQKILMSFSEVISKYYLRLKVCDKPGVLGAIANIFGENNISIASVIQQENKAGDFVPLVIMVHEAKEHDMQKSLELVKELETVDSDLVLIRVE